MPLHAAEAGAPPRVLASIEPLAMLLRDHTLVDVQPLICRVTGRPMTPRTIETKVKELFHAGIV